MNRAFNNKLYLCSGVSMAEVNYRGHGRADWGEQVKEAVDMMEVIK